MEVATRVEPCAPCVFGWMTCCCDQRVVWRASEPNIWPHHEQVALTIDDVPRKGTTRDDVLKIMQLLFDHRAKATFFVIFEQLAEVPHDVRRVFMDHVRCHGHEIGLHFAGRWGFAMPVDELHAAAVEAQSVVQRCYGLRLRYARMPGGFSTPAQVTALEALGLTVANGTAYPFDADLCQCLPARFLGRCAARLSERGGRIAILHDSPRLVSKGGELAAFLDAARRGHGLTVVTLEELLERIGTARDAPLVPLVRVRVRERERERERERNGEPGVLAHGLQHAVRVK